MEILEMNQKTEDTNMLQPPARANVLGIGISAICMDQAVKLTDGLLQSGGKGYICVTGVHGVMEAQKDPVLKDILNNSFLTTPDGMPTVWVGRYHGRNMKRVYGPDFMIEFCTHSVKRGYRHFLYGGRAGVAERLQRSLEDRIPGIQIVGWYTPPFRPLIAEELTRLQQIIRPAKPHVIWVGLSTPKQEHFMAEYLGELDVQLMVGVGAAFDIHTGAIKDAPQWIKNSGLQWAHRLTQDYRRLWKRYLINNPIFLWKIFCQLTRFRKYPIND